MRNNKKPETQETRRIFEAYKPFLLQEESTYKYYNNIYFKRYATLLYIHLLHLYHFVTFISSCYNCIILSHLYHFVTFISSCYIVIILLHLYHLVTLLSFVITSLRCYQLIVTLLSCNSVVTLLSSPPLLLFYHATVVATP